LTNGVNLQTLTLESSFVSVVKSVAIRELLHLTLNCYVDLQTVQAIVDSNRKLETIVCALDVSSEHLNVETYLNLSDLRNLKVLRLTSERRSTPVMFDPDSKTLETIEIALFCLCGKFEACFQSLLKLQTLKSLQLKSNSSCAERLLWYESF
jgi:hypothetical protein